MASLTSANTVFMLAIVGLFDAPQSLQGFAADDIFTTADIQSTETLMGVDGILSAGYVNMPVPQTIALQADSDSNEIFDQWYQAQKVAQDVYYANASVLLPSLSKSYTLTKGALTTYPPTPNVAKILQPRRFGITWQSISPANIL